MYVFAEIEAVMYKAFNECRLAYSGMPKKHNFIFDITETCTLIKHANLMVINYRYFIKQ
jgi:hypothetical protein